MNVELRNISKHFGPLKANDRISFQFGEGRIYAILGENGAGKSTLMKILSGYQTATHGQILINGQAVHLSTPSVAIQHGIGMLYQDPLDFAPLTALENYISGRAGGLLLQRREMVADFQKHCRELGFDLNPHALVETMTVGERQQLEIVRLLSLGVRFLILDEPTTGISAEQKTQLFDTLKRLAHEDSMTVVLVSHKLADVEELCDEVLALRRGQLVGHEVLPCPTERMVEMMFGKRLDPPQREQVETGRSMLQVERLPIHARLFSIPEFNLEVHEGEVIGLAGLDGSGQVEFMHTVAGLERPTWSDHVFAVLALIALWIAFALLLDESPTVMWLGVFSALALIGVSLQAPMVGWVRRQLGQEPTARVQLDQTAIAKAGYRDLLARGVVFLPAGRLEEGLVKGLTVMDHVALTTRNGKPWVNWLGVWRQAKQMIETFNVKGRPLDPIQNLSGGNQQRVSVGLLPERLRLVLLENPTRGLDVESAQRIWSILLKRREQGTSIIFSSPDLDEIIDYSDRILVFSSGRVTLVEDAHDITTARLGELIGGKA